MSEKCILIVGLGNCLMTDDGVGIHAVRQLQQSPIPGVECVDIGTDFFSAITFLENARKVLAIDAMEAGHPPGTIYECDGKDVVKPDQMASLHELGLMSILEFIEEDKRPEITVLGIQPEKIDYGLELTPTLQAVLPKVVELARQKVAGWT